MQNPKGGQRFLVGEVDPGAYVVFLVGGSGTYSLVGGTVLSLWWAEPCQGVCLEVAVSSI